MGTMTFLLPAGLSPDIVRELERACLAGGPDCMPYPTRRILREQQLILDRGADESGYLYAPWPVANVGQLMGSSATLMERVAPYHLLVELARGKLNQVRNQFFDWESGGLVVPESVREQIRQASHTFGHGVCSDDLEERLRLVQQCLELSHQIADSLAAEYVRQVFQIRHRQQERLETALSCRLESAVETPSLTEEFKRTFNRVSLPLSWHLVEAEEMSYSWDRFDRLLSWAEANELDVTAGPLIDFSSAQLPAWLWQWERDLPSMATFMCRFVESAVRRYRSRIRSWQITAASNWANVLSLSEEELMGLTFRLGETARQIDPALELTLGISQPWGEYMVSCERTSPFVFADNLIRSGLNLSGINLELIMGVQGRGSYVRDLLDVSRILDLYALLGVPLQVTLGYPHSTKYDADADPELPVGWGWWRDGYTPTAQADWAARFAELVLSKRYVHTVHWTHFADAEPHQFPACGLIAPEGSKLPALEALQQLRARHLY